ncbi:MAG: zinc-binding dehydrogenase [Deltaproteobacteria bacterium]|nr:zinc-binding dehydrogenase [Deltaproteobacteria bacterium]
MKTSKAVVLEAPGRMVLKEFPLPMIRSEEGLLKVEMVGVCGSDVGMYRGKATRAPRPYPIIMGHEIFGTIVEIGKEASKRWGLKPGDRAIVEYAFGCGECFYCKQGNYIHCEAMCTYGSMISCKDPPHLWGAYSEYLYLPPRAMVHKVSEKLLPEVGILICAVLGNAIRWLQTLGGLSFGDTVVIEGPGQQGLAGVIVAKEAGAKKVIVTGISKDRIRFEMAKAFGADEIINVEKDDPIQRVKGITEGRMADLVIDVTGNPRGAITAIDLVKKKGTVILPGLYGMDQETPLVLDKVAYKEVRVQGAFSHDFQSVLPAIRLAESEKYPLEKMVTHRFPLEEAEMAVRVAGGEVKGEDPIKVVITP